LDRYSSLSWGYVVAAVNRGLSVYHTRLHDAERPVALLSSMQANSARDAKKQRKPYTYLDFSFYKPRDSGETPDGHYGAAYLELVREKRLPAWALFCFKELSSSATVDYVPGEPAFICEDAILLHPTPKTNGYEGLLLALESASDERRVFTDSRGQKISLQLPYVETKVIARENVILDR